MGVRMRRGESRRSEQRGFTYVVVLVAIALLGVGTAILGPVWATELRRAKEQELMRVGHAIQRAIGSYYELSPGTVKQFPARLEDLLADDRFVTVRRHLRMLYVDPMTGAADWRPITSADGRIIGVASQSPRTALSAGPAADHRGGLRPYSDWKFIYVPRPEHARPR